MTNRTHVDWLAVRAQAGPAQALEALRNIYGSLGGGVGMAPRSRGWNGYRHAADLHLTGMGIGLMAWGGDNQRGWLHMSLSGTGCEWVQNWDEAPDALAQLPAIDYRRVDIALDTKDGSVSHDTVLNAYRAGAFTTSGRPPKCQRIESERPEDGRTIYIGARENDKFLRAYEKGRQLAATLKTPGTLTHIDGAPVEDLYRLELELKAKSGDLPGDLIERRDQYFAGSYPYLQHVMHDVQPEIMVIDRRIAPTLTMEAALEHIRSQYGATLFTALVAHHGDMGAVWQKVCGREHNKELVRAGVLLVDHE